MEVRILNQNPMFDYKQFCLITQGKVIGKYTTPENEVDWWIKQIVANHSTLRCIHFRIIDEIPKSCVMQIIRATKGHPQPEVCSSRPDWCGKERSNDPYELKLFAVDYTPESFIEMCKQRLCNRTETRTREVVINWVQQLRRSENPLLVALGYCCKPQCTWLGGCPELRPCGEMDSVAEQFIESKDIYLLNNPLKNE